MKVFLSPLAELKLQYLLEYLKDEWGEESRNRFLNKLEESFQTISSFSESHPKTEKLEGIYKLVITKQTSLFYRIKNDQIEVITVFDNRRDPKSVKAEIEKHFGQQD